MRLLKMLFCILPILMLCGCFDYNELNMQALVSAAGIDSDGEGMRVYIQCESRESGEKGTVYSASGGDFFDAVRNVYQSADKKPYWGHARVLIIDEEVAREHTEEIFDAILRARDVYLDIVPVITKGISAKEVLASTPEGGEDVGASISSAFANAANSKRFSPIRLWEILREREKTDTAVLPAVEVQDSVPRFCGSAVLRSGKLVGYLGEEETLFLMLIKEDASGGYLPPIELSDGRLVSFEILSNKVKKKENDGSVSCTGEFVLSPAEVRGEIGDGELRECAERYIERGFRLLFEKIEKEGLGDICGFASDKAAFEANVRISNILGGR